ncbi:MAG: hypothetical protein PHX51_04965 [Clostridia bacterium]|nr:hypothetical protein [Clostridia bacterium]
MLLEISVTQAFYFGFIGLGAIVAVALHFIIRRRYDDAVRCSAIFGCVLCVAVASAYALMFLKCNYISQRFGVVYTVDKSFFLTSALFLGLSAIVLKIMHLDIERDLNAAVCCLFAFWGVSKLGCVTVGCCNGYIGGVEIPLNLIECICGITICALSLAKREWKLLHLGVLGYTVYRFFNEFIRAFYEFERCLWVFTYSQLLAIAIILGYCAYFIVRAIKRKTSLHAKNAQ